LPRLSCPLPFALETPSGRAFGRPIDFGVVFDFDDNALAWLEEVKEPLGLGPNKYGPLLSILTPELKKGEFDPDALIVMARYCCWDCIAAGTLDKRETVLSLKKSEIPFPDTNGRCNGRREPSEIFPFSFGVIRGMDIELMAVRFFPGFVVIDLRT
jgi:hypothetical protein